MFHARVSSTVLIDRLTAEANSPEFLESVSTMKDSGLSLRRLGEIVTAPINNSIRDVSEAYRLNNSAVPLFRPVDIQGVWLETANAMRVSRDFEELHKKARVRPGNIVVAVAGTVGRAARVPCGIDYAAINGSCARVVVPTVSDGYLLAYLNTRYGYLSMMRWSVGSVQKHLNLEDMPAVTVPWPTEDVQRYIGDKVRQAERLRASAMELAKQTRVVLDCGIPPFAEQARKIARITPTLLSDRIDTQPYRTHYLSLQHALSSVRCDQLSSIATARSGDPVPSNEFCSTGIPLVRIRDISEEGFASPETYVSFSYADAKSYASAHVGDIVIGMDGEFRAQFFLDEELPQFVNQRIAIVKAHGIRPELLTAWINRIEGQYQLNRWSVKTTVDHTSLEYINMIRVPRLEPDIEEELANRLLAARLNRWFAIALTKAARILVESLIESRFTEGEFVAAENGLKRGDHTLDRAILGQLTNEGVSASDGQRLFPNIDALYAAIGEAERAHTDGEMS